MKKALILLLSFSLFSFTLFKMAPIPQYENVLYADVIFHGKISKVDSLGFSVKISEAVLNTSSNAKLLKQKTIYIPNDMTKRKPGRYSYGPIPKVGDVQIFTMKYEDKTKKLLPINRNFGIPIFADKKDSCYINGYGNSNLIDYKTVIKAIKLLHQCYATKNGIVKSKVSQVELQKMKAKNNALKLWIETIEQRNGNLKK